MFDTQTCVYAIVRNHHRANTRDTIKYIGITERLKRRFYNHSVATKLAAMRGQTSLSIASIDFGNNTSMKWQPRGAIEEIEHILIWALWEFSDLVNEKKQYSLPGLKYLDGVAWHIVNKGYRFSGRMPREIIYPWILTKPGRDRSIK